jgi:ion channel
LIYFSFVKLTTVGYGDVYPVHPAARSLAVAEALVGQLYLAILIASLVGMALQAKSAVVRDSRVNSDTSANKNNATKLLLDEIMSLR